MTAPPNGNGATASLGSAAHKNSEQFANQLTPNHSDAGAANQEPRGLTSKFPVGRYVCEMSWSPAGELVCEWSPNAPPSGSLRKKELREYRAGRDVFVQEIASTIGGNVLVVEVRA